MIPLIKKEHDVIDRLSVDDHLWQSIYDRLVGLQTAGRLEDVNLLGLTYDIKRNSFLSSYYIGATWIDKSRDYSLVITPKYECLDFMSMFMACLKNKHIGQYIDKLFYINVDERPIPISSKQFEIEPLTIVYFFNLVEKIVNQGLKKDYIDNSDILKGKVKGKIRFSEYLKRQYPQKKYDKIPCSYQEYDIDCIENRILKKALTISKQYFTRNKNTFSKQKNEVERMADKVLVAFNNVSDEVNPWEFQNLHVNPIFKLYKLALPLAKMIISKQGFQVNHNNGSSINLFPPFIIDMPILFELYVLNLLTKRYGTDEIGYQKMTSDRKNILDFIKLNDRLIIDAKYKQKWEDDTDSDNIRQLCGYARHIQVRQSFLMCTNDEYVCPCLIIYPDRNNGIDNFDLAPDRWIDDDGSVLYDKIVQIKDYQKFYKLGIKLPFNI